MTDHRELPVAPNLTGVDVLALFNVAIAHGDLDRADAWASLLLRKNDEVQADGDTFEAGSIIDGLAVQFARAIGAHNPERAEDWASEAFKRGGIPLRRYSALDESVLREDRERGEL